MNWYIKNSWVLLMLAYLPCISQTTILVTVSSGSDSIPLSGVHIINIDNRAGAVTSVNGLAAIVVHNRDTLQFSAIGYKPIQIITQPDHLDFTVFLHEDTIELAQININRQQQLHAKIMEEVPLSKELQNANKNISQMQNMYWYRRLGRC